MTDLPGASAVRRAIERRFLKFGPSVEQAMVIIGAVLEERDAEIRRLSAGCGENGAEPADVLGDPPDGALLLPGCEGSLARLVSGILTIAAG